MTTTTTTATATEATIEDQVAARLQAGHTPSDVAAALGLSVGEDEHGDVAVVLPGGWRADDGNAELGIDAESGAEAAAEYVRGGEWGERRETTWVHVRTWRRGLALDDDGDVVEVEVSREDHRIDVDPVEPKCTAAEHDWTEESVRGHGGGVVVVEVCAHCGVRKVTDTWAQDRETGEQGLTSVSYQDSDEDSDEDYE